MGQSLSIARPTQMAVTSMRYPEKVAKDPQENVAVQQPSTHVSSTLPFFNLNDMVTSSAFRSGLLTTDPTFGFARSAVVPSQPTGEIDSIADEMMNLDFLEYAAEAANSPLPIRNYATSASESFGHPGQLPQKDSLSYASKNNGIIRTLLVGGSIGSAVVLFVMVVDKGLPLLISTTLKALEGATTFFSTHSNWSKVSLLRPQNFGWNFTPAPSVVR